MEDGRHLQTEALQAMCALMPDHILQVSQSNDSCKAGMLWIPIVTGIDQAPKYAGYGSPEHVHQV